LQAELLQQPQDALGAGILKMVNSDHGHFSCRFQIRKNAPPIGDRIVILA